jgi:hypothetical protein
VEEVPVQPELESAPEVPVEEVPVQPELESAPEVPVEEVPVQPVLPVSEEEEELKEGLKVEEPSVEQSVEVQSEGLPCALQTAPEVLPEPEPVIDVALPSCCSQTTDVEICTCTCLCSKCTKSL